MKLLKNLDCSSLLSNYEGRNFYLPKEVNDNDERFYKKRKYIIKKDETCLFNRYVYLKNTEKFNNFSDKIPTENLCLF